MIAEHSRVLSVKCSANLPDLSQLSQTIGPRFMFPRRDINLLGGNDLVSENTSKSGTRYRSFMRDMPFPLIRMYGYFYGCK